MPDRCKKGGSGSQESGDALSSPRSGVEKLLAASGLTAALQPPVAAYPPAARRAPTTTDTLPLAQSLPMLDLLARATSMPTLAQPSRHSFQPSAHAVESAINSLATAIALRNAAGGVFGCPPFTADPLALNAAPAFETSSAVLPSPPTADTGSSSAAAAIRQEEIAAALCSKPQRGRKRENLNEYERIELTRTRNREHAKSTRIRKKARHEELLEMETKFKTFMEEEERKDECRELIRNFLMHRENGLRTSHRSAVEVEPSPSGHRDSPSDTVSLGDIMVNGAMFSFGSTQIPAGPQMAKAVSSSSFANLLSSEEDRGETSGDQASAVSLQPLMQQLEAFDASVVTKVTSLLGKSVIPVLHYSVPGGDDAIAFNRLKSAFCAVELKLARSMTILRGIVRFDFADRAGSKRDKDKTGATLAAATSTTSNTTKISSVQWIPDFDATADAGCGLLQSIDPMVVVAVAAESAEALEMVAAGRWGSCGDTGSSRSARRNDRDPRSTVSTISSSNSSVAASSKEDNREDGGGSSP